VHYRWRLSGSLAFLGIILMVLSRIVAAVSPSPEPQPRQQSNSVEGVARVIDGDTVAVGTIHVRLKGVDAAEMDTETGRAARVAMLKIVGSAQLICDLTGERSYKREVGFCYTHDTGTDIGQAIIEQGFALACPRYSKKYVPYEQAAARARQPRARYC
jgi:micrococcal nuclease